MKVYIKTDTKNKVIEAKLSDSPDYIEVDTTEEYSFFCDHLYDIYVEGNIFRKELNSEGINLNKSETKLNKTNIISNVVVTTSTNRIFDGDEKSQDRMARAISIASITGSTSTMWKLADNTIVEVTLDELREALSLAGQEMSRIWLA